MTMTVLSVNTQQQFRSDKGKKTVWDYIFSSYMTMMLDEHALQSHGSDLDMARKLQVDFNLLSVLYNFIATDSPYGFDSEWVYNPNSNKDCLHLRTTKLVNNHTVDMGMPINGLQDPLNRLSQYGLDDGTYSMWADGLYQLLRSFYLYCKLASEGKSATPGSEISFGPQSGLLIDKL